ncbi:glycerophosphodiester phosphodiesterase GDPD4 isoform X1 [Iris pallida]|uniref:glycerophosphodiester phosphodiesterase n=1 Tax=Iris pallida TaxID=29817 RepID=A0AAX6EZR4_IRIPA|nr:glycerophosphodiester phosphodiesterase GDPD4 isoform X1 [Iris pallida]
MARPSSPLLPPPPSSSSSRRRKRKELRFPRITSRSFLRFLPVIVVVAFVPPLFFHFRLRQFHQARLRRCGWLENPPLVCAHGGDATSAAPNTIAAYRIALHSHVDCIEIDASRSLDGELFALHDRDLQRMSKNNTAKVGYMKMKEIKELDAGFQLRPEFHNQQVPTIEEALTFVSSSVRQVVLDVKVGPPSYERGLAKDILTIVKKTNCKNCLIWTKSDTLGRDVIKLQKNATVGYIVMKDPSTGATSKLLRMKDAAVVGVYHPLIDERLVRILHRRGKKVYAWTVDDAESMQRLLFEHVDAIVTNHPSLLQGLMQDLKTQCLQEGFPLP